MQSVDLDFDRQHIWHPYSSMSAPNPVWPVSSASGVRLQLEDGRQLIDGMSSWWCAVHGYNHPKLNQAVKDQLENMSHVMFGGLTHRPAVEVSRQLLELTDPSLTKVFLADSGSVSVEVAIKMAIQYQQAQGKHQKTQLMAFRRGYHGDTLGAMSLCDPERGMHSLFSGLLPQQLFSPQPQLTPKCEWQPEVMTPYEALFAEHHQQMAAFILEPVVQGAGGMWFYHPQYITEIRKLCDHYDVLLIADEIATGFGRSGRWFGCDHAGIAADIVCVGKALTGGYMTMAATLTNDRVANTISEGAAGCFMHGPTFMGNPLACAVASASLSLLHENRALEQVARLQHQLEIGLAPAADLDSVADVRVLGAIGVIEMKQPVDMARLQPACIERGIWVRPFANTVYIMPPYVLSDQDCQALTGALVEAVAAVC